MNKAKDPKPSLSPKLLTEKKDLLVRAVHKWLKFQTNMWNQVNQKLEAQIRRYSSWSILFRVAIITLSASVTVMSNIDDLPRTLVTVVAGAMTALTGIEAFLKFGERQVEAKKQQREIEALRDDLRFEWFVKVEVEPVMDKRLKSAKDLLQDGSKAYNEVLNKYALKAETDAAPKANT